MAITLLPQCRRISLVSLAVLLLACADSRSARSGQQALVADLSAEAVQRSNELNQSHQGRTSDCVKLRDPVELIPLRYPDGTPTGFSVSGRYPASQLQPNKRGNKALNREACGPGTVEIDAREVVDSPDGKMLFHPGGPNYPYPGGQEKWGRYGHILLSDLVPPLPKAPDPYDGTPVGNGKPAPEAKPGQATYGEYYIQPTAIPDEMYYKQPHGKHTGSGYKNYGDKGHGAMYMVWNWVQNGSPSVKESDNHVPGGGYVRTVLKRGMKFERCDVAPLRTVSYGLDDAQNGWITAVYGRVFTGKEWLYGWVISSYEKWTKRPDGQIERNKVDVLWPVSRGPVPDGGQREP